jgi:hypothetical protein
MPRTFHQGKGISPMPILDMVLSPLTTPELAELQEIIRQAILDHPTLKSADYLNRSDRLGLAYDLTVLNLEIDDAVVGYVHPFDENWGGPGWDHGLLFPNFYPSDGPSYQ